MAEFTLDTSGEVLAQRASSGGPFAFHWSDLAPFAQGYVEALFEDGWDWPSTSCPGPKGFSDLAPSTLAAILKDCAARVVGWHAANSPVRSDDRTEGARFWRDRQAGLCADFPPLTASLGDDGKVYLRGAV